jgi:hypothetical protein
MSTREFDRLEVMRRVVERSLTQTKAAELMGLRAASAAFGKEVERDRDASSQAAHTAAEKAPRASSAQGSDAHRRLRLDAVRPDISTWAGNGHFYLD